MGSYVALPAALSQVLAATTVSIVPLLTGTIPIVVYGLAVGQDHPLAGIPPRGAVILAAVTGAIFWAVTLFVALLNPVVPPFVNLGERVAVVARVTRPAGLPGEVVPATWSALLWRLHDGALPGATGVRMTEEGLVLQLPAWLESEGLLEPVLGRGRIELVNAGEVPPTPGTSVSTSESPLPGAEETLDTIVSGEQLAQDAHWSGISTGKVALEEGLEASVLTLVLDEAGQETLVRFAEDNQGAFLSIVLDNTALISFPVLGAIDENTLVIRRLDPELAKILAAIMRYGPLPLVPEVEYVRR
jgi:hypothetical protein